MASKACICSVSRSSVHLNSTQRSLYRSIVVAKRHFHTTLPRSAGSPLLNLSGLSASRESQHFSKEHRIPRTEFYPYLALIKSSEVDPFAPRKAVASDDDKRSAASESDPASSSKKVRKDASFSASTSTSDSRPDPVAATATYLINELTTTKSTIQALAHEKMLLDSELRRKNREILLLSLVSTGLVLALLFPDQRSSAYQWAVGSWKDKKEGQTSNSPRRKWAVERGQRLAEGGGIGGLSGLGPAPRIEEAPQSPLPLSFSSAKPDTASPVAKGNSTRERAGRTSLFSGLFWSSPSS